MELQRRIIEGGGSVVLAPPDQPPASYLHADDYEHIVYLRGEEIPSEVSTEALDASRNSDDRVDRHDAGDGNVSPGIISPPLDRYPRRAIDYLGASDDRGEAKRHSGA